MKVAQKDKFLVGVIIFGSVRFLLKKIIKLKFFFWKKKPNWNQVKPTGFGSVWFFRAKTGSNRFGPVFLVLARFFSVWLGFSGLAWFWLGFFPVFCRFRFSSVWFFWFFAYKTEIEPAGFFKNLIGFFFRFGFFGYFFSDFLGLISFPVFLLTPILHI